VVIMRRPRILALLAPLAFLALGVPLDGCSLEDTKYDNCPSDDACSAAFGPGSTCSGGFCSAAASCTTGADCRKAAGGGACVNGTCVSPLPTDPAIDDMYTEPAGVLSQQPYGPKAPLIIGGIFSLAAAHDQALTDPIRLAVREINMNGGLNRGQQLGVVFCDNGGPGDTATGDARAALNVHCLDYLAGTLGVPYIVGPLTSSDSLTLIAELLARSYPTVLISPSATSPALTSTNASIPPHPQRMFWRTCPNDALQGQVLAKNVVASVTPAITSVSVVYINDSYGLGLSQAFQMNFSGTTNLAPYSATDPMSPTALSTLAQTVQSQSSEAILVIAEEGSVAVQIVTALAAVPALVSVPYFFTDGSMDTSLIAPSLPATVAGIIAKAQGTAPADPSGPNYDVFTADLMNQFGLTTPVSFLAQSYDATYVGAYGVVYASRSGTNYDGFDVATGLGLLESGTQIQVGALGWPTGTGDLVKAGSIDINGLSGPLQFDPTTGEAPGPIEWWKVTGSAGSLAYSNFMVIQPM
jgi:ABC-type branched-subunit amino acid transport system substrate-binding protein